MKNNMDEDADPIIRFSTETNGGHDLAVALLLYILTLTLIISALYIYVHLNIFPTIIIALIVSMIIINVIYPPYDVDFWSEFNSAMAIYGMIQVGTPIAVVIYAVYSALNDRRS